MLDTLWTSLGGGGGGGGAENNDNTRRRQRNGREEGHYAPRRQQLPQQPPPQRQRQSQSQRRLMTEAANVDLGDERQVAAAVEDGWFSGTRGARSAPASSRQPRSERPLAPTPGGRGPPPPMQTPESGAAVGGTPARENRARAQARAHWAQLARSVNQSAGSGGGSTIFGGTNSRGAARGPPPTPAGHGGAGSWAGSQRSTRSLMRDLDLEDGGGTAVESLGGGSGFGTTSSGGGGTHTRATQSRTNSTSVTLSDALLRGRHEAEVGRNRRRLPDTGTPGGNFLDDNDDQTMTSYQTGATSAAGSSIFAGFDSTFGGGGASSVGGKSSVVMQRPREEMLAELRQLLDGTCYTVDLPKLCVCYMAYVIYVGHLHMCRPSTYANAYAPAIFCFMHLS